ARLGRSEAQLKLRIGELLDALFQFGGHHELGFSSIDAYVVERCQHSAAWGRETRALARRIRLRRLERMRQAVLEGKLSTSMAELLARHATVENEVELLARAAQCTVRAMRAALTGKAQTSAEDDEPEAPVRNVCLLAENELEMLAASR